MSTVTATATPVAIAAAATRAHKRAAATTAATPVTPPVVAVLDSLDTFRSAIAAVTSSDAGATACIANLQAITLERYTFHAARYAETRDGIDVVPADVKRIVTARVWRDATGSDVPPTVEVRKTDKGLKSVGEYLSRFARVATNMAHGVSALETVDSFKVALEEITESDKSSRDKVARIEADALNREFVAWMDALPSSDRAALTRTIQLFAAGEGAAEFAPLYVAKLTKSAENTGI